MKRIEYRVEQMPFLERPDQVRWLRPWTLFVLSRHLKNMGIR